MKINYTTGSTKRSWLSLCWVLTKQSNAAVRRHNSCKVLEHRVTGTQQVLTYGPRFQPKMGLKKNGKKVRLQLHESVDSQESLEMDEYSDEDDEVFVRHDRDNEEAGKPLIKRRKKVKFKNYH